ncbi:hypothetical protein FB565_002996 [Actinoplanes lutulentus]|uniref:Competence protein CoiA-like protein n=1 Tax=Actinoplanes lutulentus TaxID=1287878 RepID=A0A327Z2W2_9ACTN|nr:competence protein CoiA family protein [Actinoplanes lutulentus]MBB2943283.1 hypothetical protein [Actinoplanes lutulentus]RAK28343.1 competence protein CoiA-like protein [Actinoplanes lutulentus]
MSTVPPASAFGAPAPPAGDVHAAFLRRGDAHQVYARDITAPEAPLFYLGRGRADEVRAYTRAYLQCPYPDCPAPELTTAGGSAVRDHFRHLPGSNVRHQREGINHFTAKHQLARWVRTQAPDAVVHVDDIVLENGRHPDVYAIVGGNRIVFEIQYSPLKWPEMRKRRAAYDRIGVTFVWVFGHTGAFCQPVAATSPEQQATALTIDRALWEAAYNAMPLLWINPFEELIATAAFTPSEVRKLMAWGQGLRQVNIDICTLDECRLEFRDRTDISASWAWNAEHGWPTAGDIAPYLTGLITPAARKVSAEADARLTAIRQQRADEAAAEAAAEDAARRQELPYQNWLGEKAKLEERYGPLPAMVLDNASRRFTVRGVAKEHWMAALLEIFDQVVGDQVSETWIRSQLGSRFGWPAGMVTVTDWYPLIQYLRDLRDDGWVDLPSTTSLLDGDHITVLASLRRPPSPPTNSDPSQVERQRTPPA